MLTIENNWIPTERGPIDKKMKKKNGKFKVKKTTEGIRYKEKKSLIERKILSSTMNKNGEQKNKKRCNKQTHQKICWDISFTYAWRATGRSVDDNTNMYMGISLEKCFENQWNSHFFFTQQSLAKQHNSDKISLELIFLANFEAKCC